jgi:hypothetical protein
MHNKKYFCYEIYKNIAVWSKNGKIAYNPCSAFTGYIKESDQLVLDEIWHKKEHCNIMLNVEHDIPISGCQRCYNQENSKLESRRMGSKNLYENFHNDTSINLDGPQGLDYSVGNLCNLKCVICGPQHSTAWVPDYQLLYPNKPVEQYSKNNQLVIQNSDFLKNLKNIHIHGGGEPLLSDNHINLLKKVKEVKGLSDVRVFYNTNATVRASDEVLKLWEECQLIELYFSIDDINDRFEYQRTGAKWQEVQDNLLWYSQSMPHNHMFNINCSWGYLNLFYLDELVDWTKTNFSANRYGDATNLIFQKVVGDIGITTVSADAYNVLLDKFQSYPQLLVLINSLTVESSPTHEKFWNLITKIDTIRHTNFKNLCPEWSKLL